MEVKGPLITRRGVLIGALAAGGAIAGWRLLGETGQTQAHRAARVAWEIPQDRERLRIAQLLRRTTFFVTQADVEKALHDGFEGIVDRLIEARPEEPPSLISPSDPTKGSMLGLDDLQQWWVNHVLATNNRFAERITYFWHNHFTSDADKASVLFLYWQNLTWRRMALGRFRDMLRLVTVDPAMLSYLDLGDSDASDPNVLPNENYARELMELFTMGPGNYTQGDVRSAAKALAGWTQPPANRQVVAVTDPAAGATDTFDVWDSQSSGTFDESRVFPDQVRFLKHQGKMGLDDVIAQVLEQPATARFIARKVASHFISARPAESTVTELADVFRRTGYDVRALFRAGFRSAEFSDPSNYRSLVRTPLEFMASAIVAVGAPTKDTIGLAINSGDAMGETLFMPPNVAGWPPNSRWISSGTMLGRLNFVSDLLDSIDPLPPLGDAVHTNLDGALSAGTKRRLQEAASDRERWLALLASPEFNLK